MIQSIRTLCGLMLAAVLLAPLSAQAWSLSTPATGLAAPGEDAVCSYSWGLARWGYASARISYPCGLRERAPAVTLTGGYTNIKEQMYWLADHLTSHGFIVITITPYNIFGTPPVWEDAHKAGYRELLAQDSSWWSPLRNRVDRNQMGLLGYSMGGGGALLAAADLGERVKAVGGLSPYLDYRSPDYSEISAATLLLGGSLDFTATPGAVHSYYQQLPTNTTAAIGILRGLNHLDWANLIGSGGSMKNRGRILVTAWLKLQLGGDQTVRDVFDGTRHQQHLSEDWYTLFQLRD